MQKNSSTGALALMNRLAQNGVVPVKHVMGMPSSWTAEALDNGDIRHSPVYVPKIHDLLIPLSEIQPRVHANGNTYLMYNPMYVYNRPNVGTWNIIRCDGGSMEVVIDIDQHVEEQITLHVSGRDTPVIIPPKTKQYRFGMHTCADIINSGEVPRLLSIDCEELVTLDKVKFSYNIADYGSLATGQKNIQPTWGN